MDGNVSTVQAVILTFIFAQKHGLNSTITFLPNTFRDHQMGLLVITFQPDHFTAGAHADLLGADLVVELEDIHDAVFDALQGEGGQVAVLSVQQAHRGDLKRKERGRISTQISLMPFGTLPVCRSKQFERTFLFSFVYDLFPSVRGVNHVYNSL